MHNISYTHGYIVHTIRYSTSQICAAYSFFKGIVPDRRRRIVPEVVLSEAQGSWGSGNLEGGGLGRRWDKGVS